VAMLAALTGDPTLPDEDTLIRSLTDVDGLFAIPPEYARDALITGTPAQIAARLAEAADSGAARVVVTFAAGHWPPPSRTPRPSHRPPHLTRPPRLPEPPAASKTVDADSLTGAVGLYEHVGFTADTTWITYQKQLG